jgi:hypothetical protein
MEKLNQIHLLFESRYLDGKIPFEVAERYYKKKYLAEKYALTNKYRNHMLQIVNNLAVFYEKATPKKRKSLIPPIQTHEHAEYLRYQKEIEEILAEFRQIETPSGA